MAPTEDHPPSRLKRGSKRSRSHSDGSPSSHPSKKPARPKAKHEPGMVSAKSEPEPVPTASPTRVKKKEPKNESKIASARAAEAAPSGDGYRWWDTNDANGSGGDQGFKWTTLSHNAVIFPPEHEPHTIPILYDGHPIMLSPAAEEAATYYAAKIESDHVRSDVFNRNFFADFLTTFDKKWLEYKTIKRLDRCDFRDIYNHLERKRMEKKDLPSSEKKRLKEEEAARIKKYTVAIVDGREEKVGNFRVEPPGLFLGRGEHPKRGKLKARIYPEDITINIGPDDPVPPCPVPGHNWGQIVHKRDVTWLCGWKDTITGGSKYVWLAAGSAFKGMSDHAKFEKARKLKEHIDSIRSDYRDGFKSKVKEVRQRSVAMYLIDKLALRVGNEKGDEEADTVGCCSLRVEHLQFESPTTVVFDFLGKDSIRYYNSVAVEKLVFENLKLFCRNKQPSDEVFHRLTVTGLNDHLKSLMDGLSAKVFRTFNASITLDQLLDNTPPDSDLNENIVFYNQQNKEVAILCNHQRALPKAHQSQMEKLDKRVSETEEWLEELQRGLEVLSKRRSSKAEDTVELTQYMPEKPKYTDDMDEKQRAAERVRAAELPKVPIKRNKKKAQIEKGIEQTQQKLAKIKADMQVKDDLKTVALGTSKINYLDPRITVAWCKKHDVPIERIFAKTLLVKFAWAMEESENFRF